MVLCSNNKKKPPTAGHIWTISYLIGIIGDGRKQCDVDCVDISFQTYIQKKPHFRFKPRPL